MSEFEIPEAEFARLAALAAESISEHWRTHLAGRAFSKVGAKSGMFDEPLPEGGASMDSILAFVRERVLPHPYGNSHPRYFAFINPTADPVGVIGDFLASAQNSNCWGGDHAATHLELRVLRWLSEIVGYPSTSEGILVSGGSMANFTALAAARRAMAPEDVRELGMAGLERPLVVYCSDQTHVCVDKAVDLLGFGFRNLRKIPSDERFRLRMDLLRDAVAKDRERGLQPAIVVGNAGTVNTGTIDPLGEIAEFCRREDLWFHADGAYGAMAAVSPRLKRALAGLELADSIAADPHKWMYVPYEAGAVLLREKGRLAAAFRKIPEYLPAAGPSPFEGPAWFNERGLELSRSFKALKVWMGLKRHGRRGYAESVERDVALARFLGEELDRRPDFERMSEPELSIVNFRFRPAQLASDEDSLERLNRAISDRLVGEGFFFLVPTVLKGRTALRVCIVNFRTRESDLVALLDAVETVGRELAPAHAAATRS